MSLRVLLLVLITLGVGHAQTAVTVDVDHAEWAELVGLLADVGDVDALADASRPVHVSLRAAQVPVGDVLERLAWLAGHDGAELRLLPAARATGGPRVSARGRYPLRAALRELARQAGRPLEVHPAVGGWVELCLRDAPAEASLEALCALYRLRLEGPTLAPAQPLPPAGPPVWARAWAAPTAAWITLLCPDLNVRPSGGGRPVVGDFPAAAPEHTLVRSLADQGARLIGDGERWQVALGSPARDPGPRGPPRQPAHPARWPAPARVAGLPGALQAAVGPGPNRPASVLVDGVRVRVGDPWPGRPGWTLARLSPGRLVLRGAGTRSFSLPDPGLDWPALPY